MAAKPKLTNQEQIKQFYDHTDHPLKEVMLRLHGIIMATDPEIGEHIKWNSPAFYYTGEMAPFDPKEYKRDIAVFNLFKGRIMLVFPGGAAINDSAGLLEGDYKDGRRTIVFNDLKDVKAKEKGLQELIKKWLALVDK